MDINELSKQERKALLAIYSKEGEMKEPEYNALVGWDNTSQPNEIDSSLRKKGFVLCRKVGTPDGSGGHIDESVTRYYSLTLDGKAAAETLKRDCSDRFFDKIQQIRNLFP